MSTIMPSHSFWLSLLQHSLAPPGVPLAVLAFKMKSKHYLNMLLYIRVYGCSPLPGTCRSTSPFRGEPPPPQCRSWRSRGGRGFRPGAGRCPPKIWWKLRKSEFHSFWNIFPKYTVRITRMCHTVSRNLKWNILHNLISYLNPWIPCSMLYRMKWETSGIMCVTVVVRMTPAPKHVRIVSQSWERGEFESHESTVNKYVHTYH